MLETSAFVYAGPNRRSDLTVIEKAFALEPVEVKRLGEFDPESWRTRLAAIHPALAGGDISDSKGHESGRSRSGLLARLYARLGISLQQAARHPVAEAGVLAPAADDDFRVFFEYEEPETGMNAASIAQATIEMLFIEGDAHTPVGEGLATLRRRVERFLDEARPLAMPADSRAIHDAARDRGVPCLRMDRPPFDPIEGEFRIRRNGLLRLGFGCRQHTVDGTFCVSRSQDVYPLIRNRKALFDRLAEQGFPLPGGAAGQWCGAALKAARLADRIGYPVCLRASRRGHAGSAVRRLPDREAVIREAGRTLQQSPRVLVQPFLSGTELKVVVAGQSRVSVLERPDPNADWRRSGNHGAARQLALEMARSLNVGLMTVSLICPGNDTGSDNAATVIDVELAPELDGVTALDNHELHTAAQAFVDWIFPDPATALVPVMAVTGTNGKTTTTRMLAQIMRAAGHVTGLACSDGSYIDDRKVSEFEDGYLPGHLTVLDNPDTEVAVLEATRGGAGSAGLGFDRCDVAACLNVTADHLNDHVGVRSVDELARLKRTILERARKVVLNADDRQCCAMIGSLGDRVSGMVSLSHSAVELRNAFALEFVAGVVERVEGREWLVIHQGGRRFPVLPVDEIPLAFEGAARHNVSNALAAAVVAWLMMESIDAISSGLKSLRGDFETTPGRLNFFRKLPFDVCMDFAHNPAGVRALAEFVDRLPVDGRRIACLSCSNENDDDFIRETAAAAAGHFDHYVCKNFGKIFDRAPEEGPRLLREGLLAAGVSPGAVTCVEGHEHEGVKSALGMGRPGDLVVIVGGKRRRELWRLIKEWSID